MKIKKTQKPEPELSVYKKRKLRKKLIEEAQDLDGEYSFIESRLMDIVHQINDLKPTKKELAEGVQELFDQYL